MEKNWMALAMMSKLTFNDILFEISRKRKF